MITKRGEENEGMNLEKEPKLSVVPDRVRGRISQPPHASRIQSPTTPFLDSHRQSTVFVTMLTNTPYIRFFFFFRKSEAGPDPAFRHILTLTLSS